MFESFSKSVFIKTLYSIFAALLIGLVCIFTGSYIIEKESLNKLKYLTENKAYQIEAPFEIIEKSADNVASIISNIIHIKKINDNNFYKTTNSMEQLDNLIKKISNCHSSLKEIFIYINPKYSLNQKQNIYFYTKTSNNKLLKREIIEKDKNDYLKVLYFNNHNTQNDNNILIIKTSKGIWSDPYNDKISGLHVISYQTPIILNKELIGFVKINISIESVFDFLAQIKVYKNDNSFLLDNHHCFISKEKNNIFINNLTEKLKIEHEGIITYKNKGVEMIASYKRIKNGFIYIITAPKNEVFQQEYNLQRLIVGIIIIGIILFFLIILNI